LLTITTTHRPASDLGYLLHKHPGRVREIDVSFGSGRVFFPQASEERCTAALLLDIEPLQLARRRPDAALENVTTHAAAAAARPPFNPAGG
jgi:hypothetical protein